MENTSESELKSKGYYIYRTEKALDGLCGLLKTAANVDSLTDVR